MYRILNVRQEKDRDFKVWYTDDYWDLFIWVDASKRISSFQLSYGKPDKEHLIMWSKDANSLRIARVETGEDDPSANRSPLLYEADDADVPTVLSKFTKDSRRIDPAIARFIISKLENPK